MIEALKHIGIVLTMAGIGAFFFAPPSRLPRRRNYSGPEPTWKQIIVMFFAVLAIVLCVSGVVLYWLGALP